MLTFANCSHTNTVQKPVYKIASKTIELILLAQVPINATALLAGPLYEEQYCILGLPCAILLHGFQLKSFNNIIITMREEGSACGDRHHVRSRANCTAQRVLDSVGV